MISGAEVAQDFEARNEAALAVHAARLAGHRDAHATKAQPRIASRPRAKTQKASRSPPNPGSSSFTDQKSLGSFIALPG